MKENLYQTLSNNCNFGVKYYAFLYNEMPNSRVYNFELNVDSFIDQIKEVYPKLLNLSQNKHFYLSTSKPEWELNQSSLNMVLKEKMVVHYENGTLVLSCSASIQKDEIEAFEVVLLKSRVESKETPHQFYMIKKHEYGSYEMAEFKTKKRDITLAENYNDDLLKLNENLIKFLNTEDENGIVLFHGLPGTGKTTYIRHLISTCSARFIYMPNNVVPFISQPDFISFISSFPGSVLVLEDGEEIVKPRETNDSNSGITNLLSLGDGLLGDALKLKIICTFNCELKKIDKALLRRGRLKFRYEFGKLTTEKVGSLSQKLKLELQDISPMTLSEIYNPELSNNITQEGKRIGFALK